MRAALGGSRLRLSAQMLVVFLASLLVLAFLPGRTQAVTATVEQVDDVVSSVGGDIYITDSRDYRNAEFWNATTNQWQTFGSVLPANPAAQDGPSVPIGNGWYVSWDYDYHRGSYLVWRYPDNKQVTYQGSVWNGFKVKIKNAGYTKAGVHFDSILEFRTVYAWQADGLYEPEWLTPFMLTSRFGPLITATAPPGRAVGIQSSFTTTLVQVGTNTPIDPSDTLELLYWDLDQPTHFHHPSGVPYYDFTSEWREGLLLGDGYRPAAKLAKNTQLVRKDTPEGTWFFSGADDPSEDPTNLSSVVASASSHFSTTWRGEACETGIGYDTRVYEYPAYPDPTKAPNLQTRKRGETASFSISQKFPYVADSNKARLIRLTDTLDPALDASKASVRVTKTENGVVSDVTNNWTTRISGQDVVIEAKNTGHGFAEGLHTFTITAPVSRTADLSRYERADEGGVRYWRFPNKAKLRIDTNKKTKETWTNTVHVRVPYEATGEVVLKAQKKLLGQRLQDNQFTFEMTQKGEARAWHAENKADGSVTFPAITFSANDIGKTYTYQIKELKGTALGYVWDTHVEEVRVSIADAGNGKLKVTTQTDADGVKFTNEFLSQLNVLKVSSKDKSHLAGAQFTLYEDNGNQRFDAKDKPAKVYSDAQLTKAIPGAAVTTNSKGLASYYGLSSTKHYWLKETKAPAGFNLDDTAHLIFLTSSGYFSTVTKSGGVGELPRVNGVQTITIADDPIPILPRAAGDGISLLVGSGAFLIVGGLGLVLLRRTPEAAKD